ncbi:hypothetical protein EVAR_84038_1 [Eumeta japonica]|uniref:Uncharacterized protein n=1 Tax=Eumeta variegata TaxID=151549 RepID=A0A4C1X6P6_EUMVA|nr:hypothetical protein EVAR_84038_1 [Eumeta japonica]
MSTTKLVESLSTVITHEKLKDAEELGCHVSVGSSYERVNRKISYREVGRRSLEFERARVERITCVHPAACRSFKPTSKLKRRRF